MPHRFPALMADPPRGEGQLWLTGGRLLDGTGGPVRDGATVLVEDGVIRRVGGANLDQAFERNVRTCTACMPATSKAGMTGEVTSGVNREGDSTDAQRQGRSSP